MSSSLKKWNYKYIKLAWIKENKRAENFWLKEGFDVVSSSVDQNNHSVIVGIKEL